LDINSVALPDLHNHGRTAEATESLFLRIDPEVSGLNVDEFVDSLAIGGGRTFTLVSVSTSVTWTPGTTLPVGSVTVPRIEPNVVWPNTTGLDMKKRQLKMPIVRSMVLSIFASSEIFGAML